MKALNLRYGTLSLLSGYFWAVIVYWLGYRWMSPMIWSGIIASPFIGLAMGFLYRNACNKSLVNRIFLSLVTLYAAVGIFGCVTGTHDALRHIPNRASWAVVVQMILACWGGITISGLFLLLWPLSFLNHTLVCRFGK